MADRRAELGFLSRATLVSIVATGAEFAILPLVCAIAPRWVAFASVQVVANLLTFVFYKYWAFDAARVGSLGRQYGRQVIVFGGSWLLNTAVPSALTYRAGQGPVLAFAISNVFVYLLWNYPLNRWWVFHERALERVDGPAATELSSPHGR